VSDASLPVDIFNSKLHARWLAFDVNAETSQFHFSSLVEPPSQRFIRTNTLPAFNSSTSVMARPQQPYDDQYGQHDSYYQDDYAQGGHPQGDPRHQQHGHYDQGYDQQGDGYYDEKFVLPALVFLSFHAKLFIVNIIMPANTMPMVNKMAITTMGGEAMKTIITVINTMVDIYRSRLCG
jgi:hypothetical protein